MKSKKISPMIVALVLTLLATAGSSCVSARRRDRRACERIAERCREAGFVPGDWQRGEGLWKDCVDPIVHGSPLAPGSRPLPLIDPAVIAACRESY